MTRKRKREVQSPGADAPWLALQAELERLRADLRRRDSRLQKTIAELRATIEGESESTDDTAAPMADTEEARQRATYGKLKRAFRAFLRERLPRGAPVAVVSRGDDELLAGRSVRAAHFPQAPDGSFAGHYPPDGTPAITQLESLRARGVRFLAFPQTSIWWLDAYPQLARHLAERYEIAAQLDDVGLVYRLERTAEPRAATAADEVAKLFRAARASAATSLSVLDWDSSLGLTEKYPTDSVFSPRTEGDALPYLDNTIDFVVVGGDPEDRLTEARRVARRAVLYQPSAPAGKGEAAGFRIEPVGTTRVEACAASIIIPTYNGIRHLDGCLSALRETLPDGFAGEVIVVDDASRMETSSALQRWTRRVPWLRVLRNSRNLGFISTCNRGAKAARMDFLVFLNDDTIPQGDWLAALLRTFEQHPDAGAVGGRLVYPDGRLQEAGNVIFRDGSGANFGRGDYEVDAPLYAYVRRVDYCSGALLATPTSLFRELGGFDRRFRPAYYEDTDYCFAVREAGRSVYYQPDSVVIHLEGATSGTDIEHGVKSHQAVNRKRFERKWRHRLQGRPCAPDRFDRSTWLELAAGMEVA